MTNPDLTYAEISCVVDQLKALETRVADKTGRLKSIHHDDWIYGWCVVDNDELFGILASITVEIRVVKSVLQQICEGLK